MFKSVVWLFTFLFAYQCAVAQQKLVVVCANTGLPIPFASAECFEKKWGTYADSLGVVLVPDSMYKFYAIQISHVGFKTTTILQFKEDSVFLIPLLAKMEDVLLTACINATYATLGYKKRKPTYYFGYSNNIDNYMWAVFLPNVTNKPAIASQISFGIKQFYKNDDPNIPIAIRLYQFNQTTGMPGDEITYEPIIITPEKFGWQTFDISSYQLMIPENGAVVSFSFPYISSSKGYQLKFKNGSQVVEKYGYSLYGMLDTVVVGFTQRLGFRWTKFKKYNINNGGPMAALKVKVCN